MGDEGREVWLDNVKIFACILVAFGHFFQSMVKSNVIEESSLYEYFNRTIYYFHVQLFFVASGYVYPKFSRIYDVHSWRINVRKKSISLGIPYFAFTILLWLMKSLAISQVNEGLESGLLKTLFLAPIAPYWFLYALFFIFLLTPTFATPKGSLLALGISLALKILSWSASSGIYALDVVASNEIWFVLGMLAYATDIPKRIRGIRGLVAGIVGMLSFLMASFFVTPGERWAEKALVFVLGLLACGSILLIFASRQSSAKGMWRFLRQYTMPIFLLHTFFAAPLRILLLKAGITAPSIHIAAGLVISLAGPILAAEVAHKLKWPEFFLYPGKFVMTRGRS